jgi:ABC-type dipeptide/oligopeptide/nickel transport system permease subunit
MASRDQDRRQLIFRSLVAGLRSVHGALRGVPRFSLLYLTAAVMCAIFAPIVAPFDPIKVDSTNILMAPNWGSHPLGTDHLGRDILSRLIFGARISVTVGFLAVFVSGTVGTIIATVSGVFRGWLDAVLMRTTDAFLALPYLMVAVTVVSILEPSLRNVILVIGLLRWMNYARVLRGEVLKISEMDYVRLAIVAGSGKLRIIATRASKPDQHTPRLGHTRAGYRRNHRGCAQFPRSGSAASITVMGHDAGRVPNFSLHRLVATGVRWSHHFTISNVQQPAW